MREKLMLELPQNRTRKIKRTACGTTTAECNIHQLVACQSAIFKLGGITKFN